jgi:hypothetical protein
VIAMTIANSHRAIVKSVIAITCAKSSIEVSMDATNMVHLLPEAVASANYFALVDLRLLK